MAEKNKNDQADREIVTTRLLDAPRELVYKAWTDPNHVAKWWGPNGFTNTIHAMDVRPGGVWRFTMHGRDGVDYLNKIVFKEVTPPERLVYDHGGEGDHASIQFHVVVTFVQEQGKTRLTMRSLFPTAEERDWVVREHGAVEGAKQHVDNLEAYLATM